MAHHGPPLHLQWRFIALIAVGGAIGTALRAGLGTALATDGFPVATFSVNLAGAFGLGMLLEALVRFGNDTGHRRVLRLGLGTGFFGGFTTYSSFAVETAGFLTRGDDGLAVGYALGTVVAGALATVLGVMAGATLHRRRARRGRAA
ncbi:camphor resistance protein CrcB [Paramicrobacterium humi]|uniref:Fluoride-specific ion channel FluC n=1 Tax=Paramicrobacterium humi TaxID=640635 RepID=A0A1H4JF00_9MICO|nr:CrcB family protein [Microbacterium humi]SEB44890.1 camphor resistance protein CrcB [Microbacterium humi]